VCLFSQLKSLLFGCAGFSNFPICDDAVVSCFSVCVYGGVCRIAEHCSRADSEDDFTAWNYGITTTPHMEWEYVANPDPKKQYTGEFRVQVWILGLQSRNVLQTP